LAAGAIAAVAAVCSQPASAANVLLDAWNFNLSAVNPLFSDSTNIDHINFVGTSTVNQTVVGGSALTQPFIESGQLQWNTVSHEGGGPTTNIGTTGNNIVYVQFVGLTGTLNSDGTITFDPNVGTVTLWLDPSANFNPNDATALATFDIIAPSGGSNLDFFGGTAANATIDVTLQLTSTIVPNLFTDQFGNNLDALAFVVHLVNSDSLLDPNFNPNPNNSGVDGSGNGTSVIHVQNNGQWNIARPIPEPSTIGLLGAGLIFLGLFMRHRQKQSVL
jgi:hypothetical protein